MGIKMHTKIVFLLLTLLESTLLLGSFPRKNFKGTVEDRARAVFLEEFEQVRKQFEELLNGAIPSDTEAKVSPYLKIVDTLTTKKDYEGDLPAQVAILIEQLRPENKEHYERFEVGLPGAILFTGPPGTGKTLVAKVLAGEVGIPFVELKSIASEHHGREEKNLIEAFNVAKNIARDNAEKAIFLFIDEIDDIGKKRGDSVEYSLHNGRVTVLLKEMDGIFNKPNSSESIEEAEKKERVIVIAATNNPEFLDPALWSRFDSVISIDLPDAAKREAMLKRYIRGKNIPIALDISFEEYAYILEGSSGRDISNIAKEARKTAAFEKAPELTNRHLEEAIVKNFGKVSTSIKKSVFAKIKKKTNPLNYTITSDFFLD